MDQPVSPRPRRGCLFYGCFTGIVCLVAILVAFLLGLHQLRGMVNGYTDAQPTPLPTVHLSAPELDAVQRRLDGFIDAIRGGRPAPPLRLTADEINALISVVPGAQPWRGKIFVIITNSVLKTQVSLPLADLGLPLFRGRYLNGLGTVNVALTNGILFAHLESLSVKGKPVPTLYMNRMREQNLATPINENASDSVALNRIQSVEVEGDALVFTAKPVN